MTLLSSLTNETTLSGFLYGCKECEHAGGRNGYDFSARCLISPLVQWCVPERKAEKYYPLSIYSYCGGDPVSVGYGTETADAPVTQAVIVCENWSNDVKDYTGSFEMLNGSDLRAYTPNGYFDDSGEFYTFLRDYQGNIRAVVNRATVVQQNRYYPYGLPTAESDGTIDNDYRYGGKEFDTRNGMNIYDFGSRIYAPDIARFWQPDPM